MLLHAGELEAISKHCCMLGSWRPSPSTVACWEVTGHLQALLHAGKHKDCSRLNVRVLSAVIGWELESLQTLF